MLTRCSPDELAIAGRDPLFASAIHVGRPNIGCEKRLLKRLESVFKSRWLSNNGPQVQEFGERLAEYVGVRNCIPTCNATIALEVVIRALGLTGEVIVPSFTFVATAHALQWQEITPVFCDVGSGSHNLDPNQIERLITPRTSAIIGVHLWGKPCDHDALAAIANQHKLKLLYDASHAFGCSLGNTMIGNFGAAEVFSFHATKFLNTFEGGAVATNDDELASKIRLMINFGFAGFDNVVHIGTNGKMNEVSAAMGLTGLESLADFIAVNKRNYELYDEGLRGLPGIRLQRWSDSDRTNYQYVALEADESETGISRDNLLAILHAENVLARKYFYPGCHRMEPYRSLFPNASLLLPRTEELVKRILVLPTGTAISEPEIHAICSVIRTSVEHPSECVRLVSNGLPGA